MTACQTPDVEVRCYATHLIGQSGQFSSSRKRRKRLSELIVSWLADEDFLVHNKALSAVNRYVPEEKQKALSRAAMAAITPRLHKNMDDDELLSALDDLLQSLHEPQLIRSVLVPRLIELLHGAEERNVRARAVQLLYPRDQVPE